MIEKRTVLVVDDSEIDHISMQYALEDFDPAIDMISAYDGQEALDLLATLEHQPNLIFLDINMPGMDGHGFLSAYAKASFATSVVVMLTSSDQTQDRQKCEMYDFVQEYLIKPFEFDDLHAFSSLLKPE